LAILIPLNSTFQFLEIPVHAFLFHFSLVHVSLFTAVLLQWKRARYHPVNKAILLWIMLWMAIPTLGGLLIFLIPTVLGLPPLLPIEAARLIMALYSIGLAFGTLKYHLFDVERWWFISLMWLLGGALVVIIDFLFVLFLHLQPIKAISLSLIVAGLLYFPIRQWLLQKILPGQQQSIENKINDAVSNLIENKNNEAGADWGETIQTYFNPAHIIQKSSLVQTTQITDSGLSLLVPGSSGKNGLLITGKNYGRKLFDQEDVQHIDALHTLTTMVTDADIAATQAAKNERKRIMQDLHDTMGAQLLTLVHRSTHEKYTEDVRSTLHSLRKSVHLLSTSKPILLGQMIAEWRTELNEKTDELDIQLEWPLHADSLEEVKIPLRQALRIAFIARESLVTSALKFRPEKINVDVVEIGKSICLIIFLNSINSTRDSLNEKNKFLINLEGNAKALEYQLSYMPQEVTESSVNVKILLKLFIAA
jgi:signal transduction histidine kinase